MDLTTLKIEAMNPLLKLKCSACNSCLSYFPIYLSGDKENICSRCINSLPQGSCFRNEIYETLAQFVQFPCLYKNEGCSKEFFPKDIPHHEENCKFRTIKCPTSHFSLCTWQGARPTYLHHCQDKHFDLMLKNSEFQFDLSQSHHYDNLLEYNDTMFIVSQKFYSINKLLEFSMYNFEGEINIKQFSCELSFSTKNRNVTVKCCTSTFNERKITEIYLDSLKDRDNTSSTVVGKISLEKTFQDIQSNPEERVHDELLSQLKCSTCFEYVLPPIYQDVQSVPGLEPPLSCLYCKGQTNSIFGRTDKKGIRNFNLDKIANLLNYPCRYKKSGCSFISKPPRMKMHQEFCLYGIHTCPVSEFIGCVWSGTGKDTSSHIHSCHSSIILNSPQVTERMQLLKFASQVTTTPVITCYIIAFADHFFRLTFGESSNYYYWTVQMIGPFQDGFMFEIEIIDQQKKRRGLMMRQHCTMLTKKDQLFKSKNCSFHKEQVQDLMLNQNLTFNVRVYK
jgi:hypothetical protein